MTTIVTPFPVLRAVSRTTMQHQVYRQLREALMSGRFEPGQKLTIRGLAEALGSSPTPVREALHRLQAERAFEMTDTGRIRVGVMTLPQLREIRDARVALEGLLAEKAAPRARDKDIKAIAALYSQIRLAVDAMDVRRYLWANFAFHRAIYKLARSELTLAAVENFWLLMGPHFGLLAPDAAHLQRSMEAHTRILEALRARDASAARAAVTDDIMQAADSLARLLPGREPETMRAEGENAT